jgi:hypothetical protein
MANGTHYEDTALTLACKHANAAMIDALLEMVLIRTDVRATLYRRKRR